ncbi:penicillin-binding protein [Phycicoccus endophyticus]|uniref:Penicillin-binding protein n=1 Tax=Phycicoccus endophyticus TaxID=1690220 RepID=A0A7G9R1J2_9MICO|nr:penicillin-binding transpeptidase domain-containing protein [Phycicoccus endophyticus]NHI18745.1 penicillin-binding protein [Phycicoccus endophyticus]QNN49467.1 penicillin-binding protein [Phycicoccus endophyticus]
MGRRIAWVAVAALVLAAGAGGLWWWRDRESARDSAARALLTRYAKAWGAKDLSGVPFAEKGAAKDFAAATKGLGSATVVASGEDLSRSGTSATAQLSVTWTLPGDTTWSYETPVRLLEQDSGWVVAGPRDGSPWHPKLRAGQTMSLERTTPARGDLLDRDGEPLMPQGTVYQVQLDPVQADAADAAALEEVTGVTPGSVVEALADRKKSGSQAPIPVITYRESDYAPRKARLEAITGVIAPTATQPLGPTRTFGQPLLGTVGEVTAEIVEDSEGRYVAGDRAGLSGLQRQYDSTLAGTPGVTVTTSADRTLFTADPVDGKDVETTLSPSVQEAAEQALEDSGLDAPAAVVAVDVPSGQVLAAANSPTNGFDRAVTGRYPPGSTFKVASTYAYLTQGVTTPSSTVPCPPSVTVDGRSFTNYAGESIDGEVSFAEDFVHSCNTAFISLSQRLGTTDLTDAAEALGIGAGWADSLGVAGAFDGSVPETTKGTDQAAAVIGQGRDEVSPLALAVMSGSIGRGTYVAPELVVGSKGSPRPVALDGTAVGQIRSMMADTATSGTASVMRGTPGGTVRAKTGTASHAGAGQPYVWLTGYQGDVAFAVLVEAGVTGGETAAPVAKAFLTDLAQG